MKKKIKIILASPRGFCAGVERAIEIVNSALETYGPPIYVRHQIVHNENVVKKLSEKGAVFVKNIYESDPKRPIIFSAHGVPKIVPQRSKELNIHYIDATCPLVSKVHMEAQRLSKNNFEIILIGHEGHPEVIGTMGQVDKDIITLVETEDDAFNFTPKTAENIERLKNKEGLKLAYITQTTLSVHDTAKIIEILKERYPSIKEPIKEDICYATSNRQNAVIKIAPNCDLFLVVGDVTSSNSKRLVEVAKRVGCKNSILISSADKLDLSDYSFNTVGITAGASAPEELVQEVIEIFSQNYDIELVEDQSIKENVHFKLPPLDLNKPKELE